MQHAYGQSVEVSISGTTSSEFDIEDGTDDDYNSDRNMSFPGDDQEVTREDDYNTRTL